LGKTIDDPLSGGSNAAKGSLRRLQTAALLRLRISSEDKFIGSINRNRGSDPEPG